MLRLLHYKKGTRSSQVLRAIHEIFWPEAIGGSLACLLELGSFQTYLYRQIVNTIIQANRQNLEAS